MEVRGYTGLCENVLFFFFLSSKRALNVERMPNFFLFVFFFSILFVHFPMRTLLQLCKRPQSQEGKEIRDGIFKPCVTHFNSIFATGSLTKTFKKREKDRPPCQIISGECYIAFINGDSCPWEKLLLYNSGTTNMILSPIENN